jgi:hypothetical protein
LPLGDQFQLAAGVVELAFEIVDLRQAEMGPGQIALA